MLKRYRAVRTAPVVGARVIYYHELHSAMKAAYGLCSIDRADVRIEDSLAEPDRRVIGVVQPAGRGVVLVTDGGW